MTLKRVVAVSVGAVVLLLGTYAGFLSHRSRQTVSLAPSGTYPVGRAEHEIADRSRTDELSPLGGKPRVLSVWLWYPAAAASGPASEYAPGPWAGLHRFGKAQTAFDRISTGTYEEAPLAAGQFPLVVLLPGLGLAAPQYSALASGLAARGYVVAGVTPTYSAGLSVIGGQAVRASAAGDPAKVDGPGGERLAAVWAADARYAADQVGVLLGTHLNRTKVVYVGHAFGGTAAMSACHDDSTCAGVADLGGTPSVYAGPHRPVLLIDAGRTPASWAYTITGARSFDVTDYARYWLAAPVRATLPLGSSRALTIAGEYLAAFLATTFRGAAWQPPAISGVREADMLRG